MINTSEESDVYATLPRSPYDIERLFPVDPRVKVKSVDIILSVKRFMNSAATVFSANHITISFH